MNVWIDSLSVLANEWQLVAVIFAFIFASQSLISLVLRKIFGDNLTPGEYLSLGLAGVTAPLIILSMLWYFTGFARLFWIIPILLILYLLLRFKSDRKPAATQTAFIYILTVFAFTLLRLAYVSQTLFPLYFDSAVHYTLTKHIMSMSPTWILNWLTASYYHLGFHFLTALFTSIINTEITRVMLILGQIILALIPFSLFFLIRHETKSNMAGWFTVILAAFGWYMPAHAVDWGKYPALTSLGLIPFVIGVALLLSEHKDTIPTSKRWTLYGLLVLGTLASIFAHSRSVIIFGVVLIAWIASIWREKLPRRLRLITFSFLLIIIGLQIIFVLKQSILVLLFDPYLVKGVWITVFVLLLSAFGLKDYSRFTFACVFSIFLLLVSVFIPVKGIIPGYDVLSLLDRPFVEMILFLPLSMLGGLGLSGLEKFLQGKISWGKSIGLLAIGIILINASFTYDFYPSDCCVIVGNDDVAAMDWMAKQLPVNARIGIASTQLKVLTSDASEGDVGADAGIWITPLTGRVTFPLPYNSDFNDPAIWKIICEKQIGYLFVGEIGYPFDNRKLMAHPEWFRPLLSMPKTRVYEVLGCNY